MLTFVSDTLKHIKKIHNGYWLLWQQLKMFQNRQILDLRRLNFKEN